MEVMHKARKGEPNLFLTLTCNPHQYPDADHAARDMKRALVLFRRRIARKFGVQRLPFIVVFERTKKGWPHMHLLLRAPYMHWKVLRAMWHDITGAWQVDVRQIKTKSQVLFYVTKYIGKDLAAFQGCKRWWRSHNYDVANDNDERPKLFGDQLFVSQVNFHRLVAWLEAEGAEIERQHRTKVAFVFRDGRQAPDWHAPQRSQKQESQVAYSDLSRAQRCDG